LWEMTVRQIDRPVNGRLADCIDEDAKCGPEKSTPFVVIGED
jgi:hypothetical protein